MIVQLHRGHALVRVGDRIARISGEAYLRGYGSPDFVAYRDSVHWEPPHDAEPVTVPDRERILAALLAGAVERQLTIEVE